MKAYCLMFKIIQMNCKSIKQHLIFLADSSLDKRLAGKVEDHLAQCKHCSHVFSEVQKTLEIADTPKPVEIDPWFAARIEQQYINIRNSNAGLKTQFNPVFKYVRMIPVAASLVFALWLGIRIGSVLSGGTTTYETVEFPYTLYDNLVAQDLYQTTFEAYLLTQGNE